LGLEPRQPRWCHRSRDEITPFPCFASLLPSTSVPPLYSIADRDRESASRLCFAVAASSPATAFSCPLSRRATGEGRATPPLVVSRLCAWGEGAGAGSEPTRRVAYINSAGLDEFGGQSTCSCAGRKMLDPGSPCHNYPTSSRVAWRHGLSWELLPVGDGRAQQRWSEGESREPHIAVGRWSFHAHVAPSSPLLAEGIDGRRVGAANSPPRCCETTSPPTAGPSSGRRHQSLNNGNAQLTGRRGRHGRHAAHRIASHHTAAGSPSHRPLSFTAPLRGCSLPGTGTHHCEAHLSTWCMHQ
jgi:hypothetical protein